MVTFAARYSMIAVLGRWRVPRLVERALLYVPMAAFAAIIAPAIFVRAGQIAITLGNPRLVAGLVAMFVAALTRNMLLTLGVGMGVLWIMQVMIR